MSEVKNSADRYGKNSAKGVLKSEESQRNIFYLGVYAEGFFNGIKYRVYDIVIDKEGDIRFKNYRDIGDIINRGAKLPTIIEFKGIDIPKYIEDDFYQTDIGRNTYWYSENSVKGNIVYRPLDIQEGDTLIRYVLKDDIEVGYYNVLRNTRGVLTEVKLSDDDMILLSGVGLEEVVYALSEFLEKLKGVLK